MKIYCCQCGKDVAARLTDGAEIYPHRKDLHDLPFWKCDTCHNYVGCHHKTSNPTNPLGHIPSPEIRELRKQIHAILDPLWKRGGWKRRSVYKYISIRIGWNYHTSKIRTVQEGERVLEILKEMPA